MLYSEPERAESTTPAPWGRDDAGRLPSAEYKEPERAEARAGASAAALLWVGAAETLRDGATSPPSLSP